MNTTRDRTALLHGILDAFGQATEALGSAPGTPTRPMHKGGLSETVDTADTPNAAWSKLSAAEPIQGWLQFQSRQALFDDRLPEPEDDWGAILAAECVLDDQTSISLHRGPQGRWHLITSRDNDQVPGLIDDTRHLAAEKGKALHYRRHWTLDDAGVPTVERTRLVSVENH